MEGRATLAGVRSADRSFPAKRGDLDMWTGGEKVAKLNVQISESGQEEHLANPKDGEVPVVS